MLPRSYLYVPADNDRFLEKAKDSEADLIILDLEDGVSQTNKVIAREKALAFLNSSTRPAALRVDADDISQLTELTQHENLSLIFLPKVSSKEDIVNFTKATGSHKSINALIESPQGLKKIDEIATAEYISSIGIGEADFFATIVLGEKPHATLRNYVRATLVIASAAAQLQPPIAPVSSNFKDLTAYEAETRELRAMGYWGRSCIHPAQVDIANKVFSADPEQLAKAREIIAKLENSSKGALTDSDGEMIDAAHLRWARSYLDRF